MQGIDLRMFTVKKKKKMTLPWSMTLINRIFRRATSALIMDANSAFEQISLVLANTEDAIIKIELSSV